MGSPQSTRKLLSSACLWFATLGIATWLVARVVSDRTLLSQFVSWVPAFAVLSVVGLLVAVRWIVMRREATAREKFSQRVLGVLVACAWAVWLWNDWHAAGLLKNSPSDPQQVRLFAWNATTVKMQDAAGLVERTQPAITLLANTQFQASLVPVRDVMTAYAKDYGHEPRTYAATSIRLNVVSLFPILHSTWMPLGVTGAQQRTFTWDGGGMTHVDVGEGLLVEVDTRAIWNRTTVVWLLDLPSDPDIPRARMMREAKSTIDSFTGAVMLRTQDGLDRPLAGEDRERVIARLRQPDLVAGDFNTPRGAWSIEQLVGSMRHARDDGAGPGVIVTYPRATPLLHIDHVFVGEGLHATGYRVIDPGVGRHWAQIADIARDTAK